MSVVVVVVVLVVLSQSVSQSLLSSRLLSLDDGDDVLQLGNSLKMAIKAAVAEAKPEVRS